ncbi:MAG TPA: porin [Blastocatellia bacterium]|nr:porin [Blastocatellia bacterium]
MTKQIFRRFLSTGIAMLLLLNSAFAQQLAALASNDAAKTTAAKSEPTKKTVDPAELEKTVNALEERIRQLEEKLAKATAAETAKAMASAPAAAAVTAAQDDLKKEVATLKEEVKKNDGFLGFLKDIEVSGVVDGYYSYNSNKVDLFTQGRAFDVRHNAFSLQMGKISLEKKNSVDSPLGFRVDLAVGETVDRIISVSDSSRNDATKHVLQAYGSYVAPGGLTIDFGKFYTPIGAEVVDTKDNFNYSRGWLFTYGPYYHTGLRAKYAFNDKVALSGFLVNGWDNVFENNVKTGKSVGVQLGLTPTKKFALTQTFMAGPEAPFANVPAVSARDNWRQISDTVATLYVTDKFTLLGNLVYGRDGDNTGKRGDWTGFAGYFRYAFNDKLAFSPRFEVLRDADGLRTGTAQTVKDITLTQEVKLANNFLTRFEYRRDFSNQKFFTNSAGAAKDNQNTFIIGLSYFFTSRGQ